jgi:dihydrodipicolinate reductase
MMLKAELIVPMPVLRRRPSAIAGLAVFEASGAQLAEAVEYIQIGAGCVENAGKDGHVSLRGGGFTGQTSAVFIRYGNQIPVQRLAAERQLFQARRIELCQSARGFGYQLF